MPASVAGCLPCNDWPVFVESAALDGVSTPHPAPPRSYFGNLHPYAHQRSLEVLFEHFGAVESIKLVKVGPDI